MKNEKVIEVNLGIGLNMFFPEPVKIVIEEDDSQGLNNDNPVTTEND
jgi:hypothetical protein